MFLKLKDEFDEIFSQDWLSGGVIVNSSEYYYQMLKELEIKERKRNPWKELRDKLNWKASDFMKAKALAFWFGNCIIIRTKRNWWVEAIVKPIEGYNSTEHRVIINPFGKIRKFWCWKVLKNSERECQGLRRYGICSHVLAVLYCLCDDCGFSGEYYRMIKSKALEFLEKWRRGEVISDVSGGDN